MDLPMQAVRGADAQPSVGEFDEVALLIILRRFPPPLPVCSPAPIFSTVRFIALRRPIVKASFSVPATAHERCFEYARRAPRPRQ